MNRLIAPLMLAVFLAPTGSHAQASIMNQRCMLTCQYPQFLDIQQCQCVGYRTAECPDVKCPYLFVPCDEYKKDSNGCPTCECQCSGFPMMCPYDCKYGTEMITDSNGCRSCRCKPAPQSRVCPIVRCAQPCFGGSVPDANGCPTCNCKQVNAICPPTCTRYCPNGFVQDQNGCNLCQCNPPRPPRCGPGTVCDIWCPNGNVLDSRGCPTCNCRAGPVQDRYGRDRDNTES